jgi:hypothetical protein
MGTNEANGQGHAPPLVVENWPPDLRRKLRMLAAQQDTTMRQLLINAAAALCGQVGLFPLLPPELEAKYQAWLADQKEREEQPGPPRF